MRELICEHKWLFDTKILATQGKRKLIYHCEYCCKIKEVVV